MEGIRGIGYSFTATLISIFSNIVLRLIYLFFFYPWLCIEGNVAHNLKMLYVLYPASWVIASVVGLIILVVLFRKVKVRFEKEKELEVQ
jgi:Na+-driven multidrug efflux pump